MPRSDDIVVETRKPCQQEYFGGIIPLRFRVTYTRKGGSSTFRGFSRNAVAITIYDYLHASVYDQWVADLDAQHAVITLGSAFPSRSDSPCSIAFAIKVS